MRLQLFASAALLLFASQTALADHRELTADERTKLVAAATAEGCSGGEMVFDDGRYQVDDAQCAEGRKYDLDFDAAFKLIVKEVDD